MRIIAHWRDWAVLAIGVYLIVAGLMAKTLINESEFPATDEERQNAKATPVKRVLVAGAGIVACVYAVLRWMAK